MDRHTTFRIGGPARRFVRPSGVSECGALLSLAEAEGWPVLVIGNGSKIGRASCRESVDMPV